MKHTLAAFTAALAGIVSVLGGSSQAAGLRPPQFARSVDIGLVSGTVIVRPTNGTTFQLGSQDRNIPMGSEIDTSRGEVDLRAAPAPKSAIRTLQDGQFSGGVFTILQRPSQRGLTVLDLLATRNRRTICRASSDAAAAGRPNRHVLALLRATAHGHFRTSGRYSAATVRGTAWQIVERCDGTLTRVQRGVVVVTDFRLHKNVTLKAGQSYLATAR